MIQIYQASEVDWKVLLQRPLQNWEELAGKVRPILKDVREKGDVAVRTYTETFDKVRLERWALEADELEKLGNTIPETLKKAIQVARSNIEAFHRSQAETFRKVETMPGVLCWRKSIAIQRTGLYIPGGTAALFSSLLMLAVPAIVAGVETIVVCTPPNPDGRISPAIAYVAHLLQLPKIYRIGGAQAIAAMAYGTETVPVVDKIFGPGNQYVTCAKQLVSAEGMAIDMPAGPSEVMVVADESAHAGFVAADLLSQAEHGVDSQVICVCMNEDIAYRIALELERQLQTLSRKDIAVRSLANSKLLIVNDSAKALELVNTYAPEHLILSLANPEEFAKGVINAGSVFLGHFTPESVGDYASGTNHTLPTNGFARAYSGVSLDSFVKKITYQQVTKEGISRLGPYVEEMAHAESLQGHAAAVRIRLQFLNEQKSE